MIKHVVWAMHRDLKNPTRKLVLMLLGDNANVYGYCWPSQKYLAEIVQISRRQIRSHLTILEDEGFISRSTRTLHGRYTSDCFHLACPENKSEPDQDALPSGGLKEKTRRRDKLLSHAGPVCWYCGGEGGEDLGPDKKSWHVDRIMPGKLGGTYRHSNIALACQTCNLDKGGKDPLEWKGVDTLEDAMAVKVPAEVEFQRKPASTGNEAPEDGGSELPPGQRKPASEREAPVVEAPIEPKTEEEFHRIWKEITGHPKAGLTDTRKRRYRDTLKAMKKAGGERDPVTLWAILLRALWSNPWRRAELNRHDSKNILSSPEQRESWIEVAITEMDGGRDGSTHHQRVHGEPTRESQDDSRKRTAILERHKAQEEEKEAKEEEKAKEALAAAAVWFRGLSKEAQEKIDREVGARLARDFPGVPESKILRKSIFLTIHRERSAA